MDRLIGELGAFCGDTAIPTPACEAAERSMIKAKIICVSYARDVAVKRFLSEDLWGDVFSCSDAAEVAFVEEWEADGEGCGCCAPAECS